ncbi:MAG: type II toxin-antitoxin system HicA family toxin [Nitrosomonadales bacterium]|nr:type II toxin-antitoxin system HicA family toxin [Nitrosomonadales bacterium]
MKAISGKALVRLLEYRGRELLRINGSHHIYGKPGTNVRLSVPTHGNQALKIGLQRHLLKLAGISENEL